MTNPKDTIISSIKMDSDNFATLRPDYSPGIWEAGITLQLNNLYTIKPYDSSKPVINALIASGHKTLLMPATAPDTPNGSNATTDPVETIQWNSLDDWKDATPDRSPPLICADGTRGRPAGTPIDPSNKMRGTGKGCDTIIVITPMDYCKTAALPGGRPDEVLLHEMVHSLRMQLGLNLCQSMADDFDTVEEFFAILIANIYRSECGYKTIRANHNGKEKLSDTLTDSGRYYQQYKSQIDQLTGEMRPLCDKLANVNCAFNPIRKALVG